jgi:hypothetical protein
MNPTDSPGGSRDAFMPFGKAFSGDLAAAERKAIFEVPPSGPGRSDGLLNSPIV